MDVGCPSLCVLRVFVPRRLKHHVGAGVVSGGVAGVAILGKLYVDVIGKRDGAAFKGCEKSSFDRNLRGRTGGVESMSF